MPEPVNPAVFRVERGISYLEGEALQRRLVKQLAENRDAPGTVVFAEHQPVITCGRSGDGSNLLAEAGELTRLGIEFHQSGRGGDVTYHGPGQWTVYPILRLDWYRRDLHHYLRLLEESVIVFLARYGLEGVRRPGLTGAWIGNRKIAAVGVAVSRWITWHGFALNIHPDLSNFTALMRPCGIAASEGGVASLEEAAGRSFSMEETLATLKRALCEVLRLEEVA